MQKALNKESNPNNLKRKKPREKPKIKKCTFVPDKRNSANERSKAIEERREDKETINN